MSIDLESDSTASLIGLVQSWTQADPSAVSSQAASQLGLGLLQRLQQWGPETEELQELVESALALFQHWRWEHPERYLILVWLAHHPDLCFGRVVMECVLGDPPGEPKYVAQIFSPFFQNSASKEYFPELLAGIQHLSIAAPILDLANHLTREGTLEEHPASQRRDQLAQLLNAICRQLAHVESGQADLNEKVHQQLENSIALVVAICDALALIGDAEAKPALTAALNLKHRRLQVEAAAALARLRDASGTQRLAELAAEPVVRQRVLAYADELEVLEQVPAQYQTELAVAESELAGVLAQPTHFGFPPSRMELETHRELYWPSYDHPVQCFLFRFTYELGEQTFSNLGIAGPLAHAFPYDLLDLPPNDALALFAGWQAEHDEIYEVDANLLTPEQRVDVERMVRRAHDLGYQVQNVTAYTRFFGDRCVVAEANLEGCPGCIVIDANDVFWRPRGHTTRPLGSTQVYDLYKGWKLLAAFNPDFNHESSMDDA